MAALYRVLFVCTGNCCRSQMAEALLRHLGGDRFAAFSAGSQPAGFVHPLAIETMRRLGVSTEGQYSKSWDEFADQPMDLIITVCDSAASQPCPQWPGRPATAHWSLPDPSFLPGSEADRLDAAMAVAQQARGWIERLIALPLGEMDETQRRAAVRGIAEPNSEVRSEK
ncbi:MAG: arsenate reductase ArsC [Planctomycetes bacterium]|nr:arsenate reductase ArsC [Planctomycetota bacterium]